MGQHRTPTIRLTAITARDPRPGGPHLGAQTRDPDNPINRYRCQGPPTGGPPPEGHPQQRPPTEGHPRDWTPTIGTYHSSGFPLDKRRFVCYARTRATPYPSGAQALTTRKAGHVTRATTPARRRDAPSETRTAAAPCPTPRHASGGERRAHGRSAASVTTPTTPPNHFTGFP